MFLLQLEVITLCVIGNGEKILGRGATKMWEGNLRSGLNLQVSVERYFFLSKEHTYTGLFSEISRYK